MASLTHRREEGRGEGGREGAEERREGEVRSKIKVAINMFFCFVLFCFVLGSTGV
jgi:hypothetical protein